MKINWKIFKGSSHCEDGVCLFGFGHLDYKQWINWHLPLMTDQAEYIKQLQNYIPVTIAQRRARQVAYRNGWMTPGDFTYPGCASQKRIDSSTREIFNGKQQKLLELIKQTAAEECWHDHEDFDLYDWCGGNFDDAYEGGRLTGRVIFARYLLELITKESTNESSMGKTTNKK